VTAQSRAVLKTYFQRGLKPTQSNYGDLIDSFALVTDGSANFVEKSGSSMTGFLVLSGDPVLARHAATKQYADSLFASAAGAPFIDSAPLVKGSSDATKMLRFEIDGFTTGNTRVLTPLDANMTLVGVSNQQTLSNKKMEDSSFQIVDNADNTKQVEFQCSGITTATLRTITIPDKNGIMAMTSDIVANSLKGWALFTGTTLIAGSGITSIANGSTGNYTVTITAQPTANYAPAITVGGTNDARCVNLYVNTSLVYVAPTTTSFIFCVADAGNTARNFDNATILLAGA